MENITVSLPVIGIIHSPLSQKFGTPRQPNLVAVPAIVEMLKPYNDIRAFEGIEQFSHLWVIWQFHKNRENTTQKSDFRASVRPPRLGGNEKIGVFATRSMYRPANIGLSVVQLKAIEQTKDGIYLHIIGGDFIDGTPVIDLKPYITYSDSVPKATSGYATEKPLTSQIVFSEIAIQQIDRAKQKNSLSDEDVKVIESLISQDPRPAYRQSEFNTEFVMRYKTVDIHFFQSQTDELTISLIEEIKP